MLSNRNGRKTTKFEEVTLIENKTTQTQKDRTVKVKMIERINEKATKKWKMKHRN